MIETGLIFVLSLVMWSLYEYIDKLSIWVLFWYIRLVFAKEGPKGNKQILVHGLTSLVNIEVKYSFQTIILVNKFLKLIGKSGKFK